MQPTAVWTAHARISSRRLLCAAQTAQPRLRVPAMHGTMVHGAPCSHMQSQSKARALQPHRCSSAANQPWRPSPLTCTAHMATMRSSKPELRSSRAVAAAATTVSPAEDAREVSTDASAQQPVTASAAPLSPEEQAAAAAKSASKAAARKAKRTPPSPISPPSLPATKEALAAAFSNGVLLVDKPPGWTSFDVCGKIRNSLKFVGVRKVGHAGTLDPAATGLLVVCTGNGTKFVDDYVAQSKVYTGTIRLGEATPSYDAEMEVSERAPWAHITDGDLARAAAAMEGDSMQVPPMYSAIKVGGQKLYNMAREGTTIEREARPITLSHFRVWRATSAAASTATPAPTADSAQGAGYARFGAQQQQQGESGAGAGETAAAAAAAPSPQDVHFEVACSKGTYVRSIARDLGRALGTVAHLTALRRESIGDMRVQDAWQLTELITQLRAAKERAEAEGAAAAQPPAAAAPAQKAPASAQTKAGVAAAGSKAGQGRMGQQALSMGERVLRFLKNAAVPILVVLGAFLMGLFGVFAK